MKTEIEKLLMHKTVREIIVVYSDGEVYDIFRNLGSRTQYGDRDNNIWQSRLINFMTINEVIAEIPSSKFIARIYFNPLPKTLWIHLLV